MRTGHRKGSLRARRLSPRGPASCPVEDRARVPAVRSPVAGDRTAGTCGDRGRPKWGPVLTRHQGPVPYVAGTGPRRSRRIQERPPGKAAGHSPQVGGNNGPAPRMTVNREGGPSPAGSRSCRGPKTRTTRPAVPKRDAQRKRGPVPADRSNLEPTPHGPVTSPPGASRARPPLRVLTVEHPPRKATHAPTTSAHS